MDKKIHHGNIELLFKEHYREFCLLSYSCISNMQAAEDIVQDVFVKILTMDEEKEIANIKGYIWIAVKNRSLKYLHHTDKRRTIEEKDFSLAAVEDNQPMDTNIDYKVKDAMTQLPEQCKRVFELCAMEGEKYSVAAEEMGISINTVKTQMKKAYRILRAELRKEYIPLLIFAYLHTFLQLF